MKWTDDDLKKLKEVRDKYPTKTIKEIAAYFPDRSFSSIEHALQRTPRATNSSQVNSDLEKGIIKIARSNKVSVIDLANNFNVSPNTIVSTVESLHEKGYIIQLKNDRVIAGYHEETPTRKIDIAKFFNGKPEKVYMFKNGKKVEIEGFNYKFGAVADTHLGSKYERLDVLNALYDVFEKEGVNIVLHGGNYVDGEFKFNKFETKTHGFDEMIDYFLKNYPKRKGIKTLFISGDDHEGWWTQQTGIDPGRVIEERQKQYGRDDLVYLGYQEADLELQTSKGKSLLKLMHGGKGTSYADSYRTQKIVEGLAEGEKPHILLVGHYHKAIYHTPRGVHTLLLGTTQGQSRFMRKMEIKAYLGGWLVEINQAPTGEINRFKPEWIPFWDKEFYKEKLTSKEATELSYLVKDS